MQHWCHKQIISKVKPKMKRKSDCPAKGREKSFINHNLWSLPGQLDTSKEVEEVELELSTLSDIDITKERLSQISISKCTLQYLANY